MIEDNEQQPIDPLENLLPEEVSVEVAGEKLTISPFKTKHLRYIAEPYAAIRAEARKLGKEAAAALIRDAKAEGRLPTEDELASMGIDEEMLHARCVPYYEQLVLVATGKTAEWLGEVDIDETMKLAAIVYAVNAKKYEKKMLAVQTELMKALRGQ